MGGGVRRWKRRGLVWWQGNMAKGRKEAKEGGAPLGSRGLQWNKTEDRSRSRASRGHGWRARQRYQRRATSSASPRIPCAWSHWIVAGVLRSLCLAVRWLIWGHTLVGLGPLSIWNTCSSLLGAIKGICPSTWICTRAIVVIENSDSVLKWCNFLLS